MGATQSTELQESLADIKPGNVDLQAPLLLKLNTSKPDAGWQQASTNAVYKFYNANEDTARQTRWYLEIESADVDMLVEEASEMQVSVHERKAVFFDAENATVCTIIFPSNEDTIKFCDDYNNRLYENLNTKGEADLGTAGDWFFRPADVEPMDWEPTEDPLPDSQANQKLGKQKAALQHTPEKVTGFAMGAGDNSFLISEGNIKVLKNEIGSVSDTSRGFCLTPPPRTGLGSETKPFTASKVMLAQNETQMNMLTPVKRESVVQADLESGQVVREWKCVYNGVEVPMADIASDNRAAQLEHRSTFLGLDSNRICRWDQRTPSGVVQDLTWTHGKDYASHPKFSCMATSGDGYVAVGSKDGKVRLYGSKKAMEDYGFARAATSVPGLGAPVTAVDVSFDARYIVATTDKYLMVISTVFRDAKGAETNGFVSRMGSNTPPPKLLRLKPEDRIRAGQDAKFSKARLTWVTERDVPERWIAATCGNYTVLWNFRKVKLQKPNVISCGAFTICDHYSMIKKDEQVVDNAFLHDRFAPTQQAKNALVVATQHQVYNFLDDESSDFE